MNYNEEYRTTRGRLLKNCNRCAQQRNTCSCTRNAETACYPKTETRTGFDCAHNETASNSNCCKETETRTSCGCDTTIVRETRNTACPRTVCTTVPVAESCVDTYPVAMAYVPMQQWRELYDPASAISRGTIFRELDLEWYPTNCRKDCRRS